ncbi:hypothetical protein LTR39_000426 [Cryomyces antarcticus]|nr:hypothetical protein LTR39_000426 [Cryomyces antarcticus]
MSRAMLEYCRGILTATFLHKGYPMFRSHRLGSNPDIVSPVHPDRPIRPLPKTRIGERLSPLQRENIKRDKDYPADPPIHKPLFGSWYNQVDKGDTQHLHHGHGHHAHDRDEGLCTCGDAQSEIESEEEDDLAAEDGTDYRYNVPFPSKLGLQQHKMMGPTRASPHPPPPDSTTSSADGYESFENTNNKKKRKIPDPNSSGSHRSSLSADMASMGINTTIGDRSSTESNGTGVAHYYGTGSSAVPEPRSLGVGISGPGRGRYGRSSGRTAGERRPLGALTNGLNALAGGMMSRSRGGSEQGIISAAIANAAEQGPVVPQKGRENVSLLSQVSQSPPGLESTPQKTQFTFTCDSDSPNKVVWPGQNGSPLNSPTPAMSQPHSTAGLPLHGRPPVSTQGTQTSPAIRGAPNVVPSGPSVQPLPANQTAPLPPFNARGTRKPRRPGKEYALAARHRRMNQEVHNYQNRPLKREDIWICEFCEYEDIFGHPPEALIRQYETKDRKERKRLAEKRRLLEKAKTKNRKGKKGGKNTAKINLPASAVQMPPPPNQPNQKYDQPLDQTQPPQNLNGHGEDDLEDDYDSPPPQIPPQSHGQPAKINGNQADGRPGTRTNVAPVPPGGSVGKAPMFVA